MFAPVQSYMATVILVLLKNLVLFEMVLFSMFWEKSIFTLALS